MTNFRDGAVYLQSDTGGEDHLIGRCLAGDADAFEPLVRRYHPPLFSAAVRMLGDREEARDATQRAFLKAYQALATWDPRRRFFSWIYRILINDCLNTLRDRRATEPMPKEASTAAVAADRLETRELTRRVRTAVLRLPADQRDVVVLRHFSEMSYEEIAAALGIAEKTVKSRLFSARQRLCDLLAAEKGLMRR